MCHWVWWSWRVISHSSATFVIVLNCGDVFHVLLQCLWLSFLFSFSSISEVCRLDLEDLICCIGWENSKTDPLFLFYFIFLQSCRPWDRGWRVCKYDLLPWIFWKLIFSTGKLLCDSNSDCGKINPVGNGFEGSSVIIPLCPVHGLSVLVELTKNKICLLGEIVAEESGFGWTLNEH